MIGHLNTYCCISFLLFGYFFPPIEVSSLVCTCTSNSLCHLYFQCFCYVLLAFEASLPSFACIGLEMFLSIYHWSFTSRLEFHWQNLCRYIFNPINFVSYGCLLIMLWCLLGENNKLLLLQTVEYACSVSYDISSTP